MAGDGKWSERIFSARQKILSDLISPKGAKECNFDVSTNFNSKSIAIG